MVAQDLAAQSQARMIGESALDDQGLLGFSDLVWLALKELYAAGRAARVAATGMKLIEFRFVAQGVHEPLPGGNFKRSDRFNRQFRHGFTSGGYITRDR